MTQLTMALRHECWPVARRIRLPLGHHAIWIWNGSVERSAKIFTQDSALYACGDEFPLSVPSDSADVLIFSLNTQKSKAVSAIVSGNSAESGSSDLQSTLLLEKSFSTTLSNGLLRLDSVSFPPGVQAFRHVHAGPGIRHLTQGSLTLRTDDHIRTMHVGDSWFEDDSMPVQATGSDDNTSSFVRALFLPEAYQGKPTIKLLNPEDEAKPRLQSNCRYLDQLITL